MRLFFALTLTTILSTLTAAGQDSGSSKLAVINSDEFGVCRKGIVRLDEAQVVALGGYMPVSSDPAVLEPRRQAYLQRLKLLADPIEADIARELASYARDRGLALIDIAKYPDAILVVKEQADITKDFIGHYNNLNISKRKSRQPLADVPNTGP